MYQIRMVVNSVKIFFYIFFWVQQQQHRWQHQQPRSSRSPSLAYFVGVSNRTRGSLLTT